MMKRILYKLIGASAVNPGAGGIAATALTGLPALQVEYTQSRAAVVAHWAHNIGTGFHQLFPESGHDPTRGNRILVNAGESRNLLRKGKLKPVRAQEQLTYMISGSGAAVEYGAMLMAYPEHPGGVETFLDWEMLNREAEPGKETTIYATLNSAGTEGFGGRELFQAETTLLKANRRYAIVGASLNVDRAALTFEAPDFGGVVIGMPGDATNPEHQAEWFVDMSRLTGLPIIPTFQSGNLPNCYVGCIGRTGDAATVVSIHLELLKE